MKQQWIQKIVRGCWLWLFALSMTIVAQAETRGELNLVPSSRPAPETGRPIVDFEVQVEGTLWPEAPEVSGVKPGDPFTPQLGRRILRSVLDRGGVADASLALEPRDDGVKLILTIVPSRVLEGVEFESDHKMLAGASRALGVCVAVC